MQAPFNYGKLASGIEFTNRKGDIKRLTENFQSGINSVLISPRRWGKSSLVLKTANTLQRKNKKIRFCFIDLYNIRSEEEFYESLIRECLKATSGKMEEILNGAKKFLGRYIPTISYSPDTLQEFSISLNWEEVKRRPAEALDFAEKTAKDKRLKLIVCIDEFQNISEFKDPEAFQRSLRSVWQKHKSVSYCLYGSKRHMMMDVFTSPSMPFYKFGDIIFLQKIAEKDWIKFIIKRFTETGKKIEKKNAALIAEKVNCHPYYVQQLAQQVWLRTKDITKKQTVESAHDSLTLQMSLLFQNITNDLTATQVNFLKALLSGIKKLSSKETLETYSLGTSANVARIKEALENKEIIDIQRDQIEILDPLYACWLKKYYFELK